MQSRLSELGGDLSDSRLWDDPVRAQQLGRECARLQRSVDSFNLLQRQAEDVSELLDMAEQEGDEALVQQLVVDLEALQERLERQEFARMFSGEADNSSAYVHVQAGTGGIDAQDWAHMLMRMYSRWAEQHEFAVQVQHLTLAEVAGIRSASLHIEGDYAYGWLRTETGIHRLVRKSPFNSAHSRETSFASIAVSPEVDEDITVEINPADIRVDTYRAQGAGGQHVNTTDSAVRITHAPSGIVVQCQNQRSQHQNRDRAMKQLRSRLYDLELEARRAEVDARWAERKNIGWGNQIRSYVLDQSRVKDVRTGIENSNSEVVLNGDLDAFIEASLKQGL